MDAHRDHCHRHNRLSFLATLSAAPGSFLGRLFFAPLTVNHKPSLANPLKVTYTGGSKRD
jgi:hypothetical protein